MKLKEIGDITNIIDIARGEINQALFDFDWSKATEQYLKTHAIEKLDTLDKYYKELFKTNGDSELIIYDGQIYIIVDCPWPKKSSESIPWIRFAHAERAYPMSKVELNENTSDYLQEFLDTDLIWGYIYEAINVLLRMEMSVENKFVVKGILKDRLKPMAKTKYYSEKSLKVLKTKF